MGAPVEPTPASRNGRGCQGCCFTVALYLSHTLVFFVIFGKKLAFWEYVSSVSEKKEKQSWLRRYRWLLLSFFIPFIIATVGYHFVYVCDAGIRGGQAYDTYYPNIPIEKAVEMEEESRWRDIDAWGLHAVVLGLPAGFFMLAVTAVARFSIRLIRSQTKDDAA